MKQKQQQFEADSKEQSPSRYAVQPCDAIPKADGSPEVPTAPSSIRDQPESAEAKGKDPKQSRTKDAAAEASEDPDIADLIADLSENQQAEATRLLEQIPKEQASYGSLVG